MHLNIIISYGKCQDCNVLSQCPVVRLIGGSGGKLDGKLGWCENLRWGK